MHPAIRKGGVAVITGGGEPRTSSSARRCTQMALTSVAGFGGIGYALAATFAAHGMRICLIDNNASALREATDALKGSGGVPEGDVLGIEADVARYEDLQAAAKQVEQTFGKDSVRVLCLNAGMGASGATTWNGRMDIWTKVSSGGAWAERGRSPADAFLVVPCACADPRCQPLRRRQWLECFHRLAGR